MLDQRSFRFTTAEGGAFCDHRRRRLRSRARRADVVQLVPEDELGKAASADAFVTALKAVTAIVHDFDRDHPKALPDLLEAWVAFEPTAEMTVTLASGDGAAVNVAELDGQLAAIAAPDVKTSVAMVLRFTRDGAAAPSPSTMRAPAAWRPKASGGSAAPSE